MEENLNEQLPDKLQNNKGLPYYATKGKKRDDVLIGFFGGLGAYIVIGMITAVSGAIGTVIGILALITYIVLLISFIKKGRKFLAIGLLLVLAVPLIIVLVLFGTCALGLLR
jgi:hypothetical protein